MASIAFLGPDGAGKTTLCNLLKDSSLLPFKYLYMGINIQSSNVSLPTSRLAERMKPYLRNGNRKKGKIWQGLRLLNRLAEEWYRQALSWMYQLQGYVVLYDRYFLFDFLGKDIERNKRHLSDRLHRWVLIHFYPRPDLVIYLDAPAEVLLSRKQDSTREFLEARRQSFLQLAAQMRTIAQVDATRPLEEVYGEVSRQITAFYSKRTQKAPRNELNPTSTHVPPNCRV